MKVGAKTSGTKRFTGVTQRASGKAAISPAQPKLVLPLWGTLEICNRPGKAARKSARSTDWHNWLMEDNYLC